MKPSFSAEYRSVLGEPPIISTETITLVALNRLLEWLSKIFSSNAIALNTRSMNQRPF